MIKIIPLAIPVFFALIAVELVVARLQGRPDYLRFSDAISALSCGIGSQVAKVFLGVVVLKGVAHFRAVVAFVADSVEVGVDLVGIQDIRADVADVAHAVTVDVLLVLVEV